MIGELIPTGVTYGIGREALNDQFSGTGEFNNVEVSGNLSAGTGGVIYSGGTDLYNIFGSSSGNYLPLTVTGVTIVNVDDTDLFFTGNTGTSITTVVVGGTGGDQNHFTQVADGYASIGSIHSGNSDYFYVVANQVNGASLEYNTGTTVNLFKVTKSTMRASSTILTFPGITYDIDYSANYTNRSLVDKQYVVNTIATATTASNGLTKSGDNITLGGQISGDTIISLSGISTFVMSGDSGNSEQIKIQSSFINSEPASLIVGKGSAGLYSESGSSSVNSYASVSGSYVQIGRDSGATIQQINITDTGMKITDSILTQGLIYDSNYHANYTNRSLIDKEYVDLAVASGGGGVESYLNLGTTGSTINWNVSGLSTNYQVTLSAATTLNLTNVRNGEYGTIIVTQDGVGGSTITFGTVNGLATTHRVVNGGGGAPTLTSTASATDILSFTYNGSTMYWTVGNDYT
jgi:predicted outer membrane repeat protein